MSMNVLVLGATGMLGHKLMQTLSSQFTVTGTVRTAAEAYASHPILGQMSLLGHIRVEDFDSIVHAVASTQPDVAINCVGIVKQRPKSQDPLSSIAINALFPHRLARLCEAAGSRLIQLSTDCVFSGDKGDYVESDPTDATDLYGRTKLLGEPKGKHCFTVRTSIVGRELHTTQGLLEWFFSQSGSKIRGYRRAVFSGFSTQALAEILAWTIEAYPDIWGVWHVASKPISKYELLSLVKQVYGLEVEVEPDDRVVCDRSLNADRFQRETAFVPPSWLDMIESMYQDPTPYEELRRTSAH